MTTPSGSPGWGGLVTLAGGSHESSYDEREYGMRMGAMSQPLFDSD